MKRLINRRCNERSETIIAIHMYIRCEAERRVVRRDTKGVEARGGREYFSPPDRYYTITTIIIIVIAIILLL